VGTRVPSTAGSEFDSILERAYRELAPKVLGYLRGLGAPDAEDLTGEVFVQMVRDIGRFEGDERALRAWALTIAHHRFLDGRRRASRRPFDPVAEVPEPAGAADGAERDALRELADERVRELLARLSADQRAVLLLRIVGGLTVEEVSAAVGKRTGAVKALQRRGLAAIRRELERQAVPL
jgi:RNA polymerase sigma factor (sigma-70 family)